MGVSPGSGSVGRRSGWRRHPASAQQPSPGRAGRRRPHRSGCAGPQSARLPRPAANDRCSCEQRCSCGCHSHPRIDTAAVNHGARCAAVGGCSRKHKVQTLQWSAQVPGLPAARRASARPPGPGSSTAGWPDSPPAPPDCWPTPSSDSDPLANQSNRPIIARDRWPTQCGPHLSM